MVYTPAPYLPGEGDYVTKVQKDFYGNNLAFDENNIYNASASYEPALKNQQKYGSDETKRATAFAMGGTEGPGGVQLTQSSNPYEIPYEKDMGMGSNIFVKDLPYEAPAWMPDAPADGPIKDPVTGEESLPEYVLNRYEKVTMPDGSTAYSAYGKLFDAQGKSISAADEGPVMPPNTEESQPGPLVQDENGNFTQSQIPGPSSNSYTTISQAGPVSLPNGGTFYAKGDGTEIIGPDGNAYVWSQDVKQWVPAAQGAKGFEPTFISTVQEWMALDPETQQKIRNGEPTGYFVNWSGIPRGSVDFAKQYGKFDTSTQMDLAGKNPTAPGMLWNTIWGGGMDYQKTGVQEPTGMYSQAEFNALPLMEQERLLYGESDDPRAQGIQGTANAAGAPMSADPVVDLKTGLFQYKNTGGTHQLAPYNYGKLYQGSTLQQMDYLQSLKDSRAPASSIQRYENFIDVTPDQIKNYNKEVEAERQKIIDSYNLSLGNFGMPSEYFAQNPFGQENYNQEGQGSETGNNSSSGETSTETPQSESPTGTTGTTGTGEPGITAEESGGTGQPATSTNTNGTDSGDSSSSNPYNLDDFSILDYDSETLNNLPIVQLLTGKITKEEYQNIANYDVKIPGLDVTLPGAKDLNLQILNELLKDPNGAKFLDSLYKSGNDSLDSIYSLVKDSAPLGSAYETSLIKT